AAALADDATPAAVGAWVTISPDGAVVLAIPVAEMGQGSSTGLAMVFAEEMDADWSRVSITYPPVKPEIFGNPIFGNMMVTYGSGSIRGYWDKVRLQAAARRNVLMAAGDASVPTDTYNSFDGLKDFLGRAAKLDDKGVSYVAKGDADEAFAKAAKVMTS